MVGTSGLIKSIRLRGPFGSLSHVLEYPHPFRSDDVDYVLPESFSHGRKLGPLLFQVPSGGGSLHCLSVGLKRYFYQVCRCEQVSVYRFHDFAGTQQRYRSLSFLSTCFTWLASNWSITMIREKLVMLVCSSFSPFSSKLELLCSTS